ncbi:MAG TPA: FmdB family zinc ribbon protein [Planctomycetota bacterium]|nr:FmdB family zinc ribbon protein [Planctomycetota bacterium]
MPTYEYRCSACGAEMEIFQSITEAPKRKCPECGARKLGRKIGAGAGFLFRGSGFYQTDYRSESYRKAEAGEKDGGAKPAEPAQGSDDGKADGKAGEKPAKPEPEAKPKPASEPKRSKPQ